MVTIGNIISEAKFSKDVDEYSLTDEEYKKLNEEYIDEEYKKLNRKFNKNKREDD